MNTDERGYLDDAMTERVLGAIFEVSNTLGAGFLFPSRLMRRLWPGSHHFACPAISWTLH